MIEESNWGFIILKTDGSVTRKHLEAIRRVYPNADLYLSREDIDNPDKKITDFDDYEERLKSHK